MPPWQWPWRLAHTHVCISTVVQSGDEAIWDHRPAKMGQLWSARQPEAVMVDSILESFFWCICFSAGPWEEASGLTCGTKKACRSAGTICGEHKEEAAAGTWRWPLLQETGQVIGHTHVASFPGLQNNSPPPGFDHKNWRRGRPENEVMHTHPKHLDWREKGQVNFYPADLPTLAYSD